MSGERKKSGENGLRIGVRNDERWAKSDNATREVLSVIPVETGIQRL